MGSFCFLVVLHPFFFAHFIRPHYSSTSLILLSYGPTHFTPTHTTRSLLTPHRQFVQHNELLHCTRQHCLEEEGCLLPIEQQHQAVRLSHPSIACQPGLSPGSHSSGAIYSQRTFSYCFKPAICSLFYILGDSSPARQKIVHFPYITEIGHTIWQQPIG